MTFFPLFIALTLSNIAKYMRFTTSDKVVERCLIQVCRLGIPMDASMELDAVDEYKQQEHRLSLTSTPQDKSHHDYFPPWFVKPVANQFWLPEQLGGGSSLSRNPSMPVASTNGLNKFQRNNLEFKESNIWNGIAPILSFRLDSLLPMAF